MVDKVTLLLSLMSKAYDRIEWIFLEKIMHKLGFSSKWITLAMRFVSSVSYLILINGGPINYFFPTKGLRQEDLLSPYLFLICAKGLSSMLRWAEARGDIYGVKICKRALLYLFFYYYLQMIVHYLSGP